MYICNNKMKIFNLYLWRGVNQDLYWQCFYVIWMHIKGLEYLNKFRMHLEPKKRGALAPPCLGRKVPRSDPALVARRQSLLHLLVSRSLPYMLKSHIRPYLIISPYSDPAPSSSSFSHSFYLLQQSDPALVARSQWRLRHSCRLVIQMPATLLPPPPP